MDFAGLILLKKRIIIGILVLKPLKGGRLLIMGVHYHVCTSGSVSEADRMYTWWFMASSLRV